MHKINLIKGKNKTNHLAKFFQIRNNKVLMYEKYFILFQTRTRNLLSINEFCENINSEWIPSINEIKINLNESFVKLTPMTDYLIDKVYSYSKSMKLSKTYSFRMINLARFMNLCSSNHFINDVSEMKGEVIVSNKQYLNKLKEFYIKYRSAVRHPTISEKEKRRKKISVFRINSFSDSISESVEENEIQSISENAEILEN